MKGYTYSFIILGILLSGCNANYNKEAEKKAKQDSSIQRLIALEKEITTLQSEENASEAQKRRRAQTYEDAYNDGQINSERYSNIMRSLYSKTEEDKQRKSKLAQLEEEKKNLEYSLKYNS